MSLSSLQLEAFYTLAQLRNFTKAAEQLHVSQSALSQRILNLESELETTLFIRDRAGVQLTEVGWELLRYCQTKEHLEGDFLARLRSRSAKELRGVIRIGGFSSVMRSVVLPALADLFAEHPQLQLQFVARELSELPELLKRGAVDFIVLADKIDREELESLVLGEELNVLVEKKGYKGPEVYLDHDADDQTTALYMKLAKRKTGDLQRRYLDDVYGLVDGVRAGIGRAVLPMHLIKEHLKGTDGLHVIKPEVVLRIPVVLHYYKQPYYTRLHQAVTAALSQNCRKLLEGGRAG